MAIAAVTAEQTKQPLMFPKPECVRRIHPKSLIVVGIHRPNGPPRRGCVTAQSNVAVRGYSSDVRWLRALDGQDRAPSVLNE